LYKSEKKNTVRIWRVNMTIVDQLQTRIDAINLELVRLQGIAENPETAQVAGDGPDRVQLPTLSAIYKRMEVLEKERDDKQARLNRLSTAGRVQTRPVATVRFR
jgi:hypothetical protein